MMNIFWNLINILMFFEPGFNSHTFDIFAGKDLIANSAHLVYWHLIEEKRRLQGSLMQRLGLYGQLLLLE